MCLDRKTLQNIDEYALEIQMRCLVLFVLTQPDIVVPKYRIVHKIFYIAESTKYMYKGHIL